MKRIIATIAFAFATTAASAAPASDEDIAQLKSLDPAIRIAHAADMFKQACEKPVRNGKAVLERAEGALIVRCADSSGIASSQFAMQDGQILLTHKASIKGGGSSGAWLVSLEDELETWQ